MINVSDEKQYAFTVWLRTGRLPPAHRADGLEFKFNPYQSAVANASARDIGRATGKVAGNVTLAVTPGAALSKAAALRRLPIAMPHITFDPPQIGWVKETTTSKSPGSPITIRRPARDPVRRRR